MSLPYRPNKLYQEDKVSLRHHSSKKEWYVFRNCYISTWDKTLCSEDGVMVNIVDVREFDIGGNRRSYVKVDGELNIDKEYYTSVTRSEQRELRLKKLLK